MPESLVDRLEKVWQVLMVIGEDRMARTVAEAKHALIVQGKQLRGEPVVLNVTAGDSVDTVDGAG